MNKKQQYVNYIDIPDEIPNLKYSYRPCGKSNKNRPVYIKYKASGVELKLSDITNLKNDIINTKRKYVYPLVFVHFAAGYDMQKNNIVFNEDKLFKLQVWSNQLREYYDDERYDKVDYLAYVIGCKILKYAMKKDDGDKKDEKKNE